MVYERVIDAPERENDEKILLQRLAFQLSSLLEIVSFA